MQWKRTDITDFGSWPRVQALYERGDPEFVDELRRITDANRLGEFAALWFADPRPAARRLLLAYLEQPLNAFRHEALVKRLFKLADRAGDTEVMGRFLLQFDRSIQRRRASRRVSASEVVSTKEEADERVRQWKAAGYDVYSYPNHFWDRTTRQSTQRGFRIHYSRPGEVLTDNSPPAIWRPYYWKKHKPQWVRQSSEPPAGPYPVTEAALRFIRQGVLFSLETRRYLRRRAWRFFRLLGKKQPERYIPAVVAALKGYEDRDTADGVALLDRWGLVHILFHHSPALRSNRNCWSLAPGHGLAELAPAPLFEPLWQAAPRSLLELLRESRCRTVRHWALLMIRRGHDNLLQSLTPDDLYSLLASDDPTLARLAADILRGVPDLAAFGVERLLKLLETAGTETFPILCELYEAKLSVQHVPADLVVRLACGRPLPLARLGFRWLQARPPATEAECQALLGLLEAESEPLRPELVAWLRGVLGASPHFREAWVLDYLDSRHDDVRAEGWRWLQAEPRARDHVDVWRKLLESPYDDVRLPMVAELEKRVAGSAADVEKLDPELLRFLWASVLLNVHRGGRTKPVAVAQLVRRLERHPAEAEVLLPILAVALRSLRGPEWRAGLTGVVRLVSRNPDLGPLVVQMFPELKVSP